MCQLLKIEQKSRNEKFAQINTHIAKILIVMAFGGERCSLRETGAECRELVVRNLTFLE